MINDLDRLKDKTILVVEYEDTSRRHLVNLLKHFFKEVLIATDGISGIQQYYKYSPDIVMTEIELPKMDGFEFIKSIKEYQQNIHTIIISASTKANYLLKAIDYKVDKYLLKPINEKELFATFEIYLKQEPQKISLAENTFFNMDQNILIVLGKKIQINKKETNLLKLFSNNYNKIITYEDIENYVWGENSMSLSALRSVIRDLRKKLKENIIENISGVGYRINKI